MSGLRNRQRKEEGAAPPLFTVGPEPSAVAFNQVLGNRQPQPGPLVGAIQATINLNKRLEEAIQFILGNANPGIPDSKVNHLLLAVASHFQPDHTDSPGSV